ncbi:hypothetical protein FRC06_001251 [Ceratobasidium sp. 370]|nr:hypothetical protein FRC06_001251 [Ceratobasidium sp. 370]
MIGPTVLTSNAGYGDSKWEDDDPGNHVDKHEEGKDEEDEDWEDEDELEDEEET